MIYFTRIYKEAIVLLSFLISWSPVFGSNNHEELTEGSKNSYPKNIFNVSQNDDEKVSPISMDNFFISEPSSDLIQEQAIAYFRASTEQGYAKALKSFSDIFKK